MARLRITLDGEGGPSVAVVTLSRRNLLTLLHKLDMPGSRRMIANSDVEIDGAYALSFRFLLQAEDDVEHYGGRDEPPGEMHPASEGFIRQHGGWSPQQG